MYGKMTSGNTRLGVLLMAATLLLGAALATLGGLRLRATRRA